MKRKEPKEIPEGVELPKKKGLMRVIELLDRDSGKFFKAGVLALIGLIPFFVAVMFAVANGALSLLLLCAPTGMLAMPQLLAAADTVMRSMRDEVGWWFWDTYKTVWKRNFRAALLPGAIGGLLVGLQIYCVYSLTLLENPTSDFLMLLAAMAIATAITQFYFPLAVCMELPFGALARNCFVMFFCHPVKALLAALVQLIYWGIMLTWFPLTLVILVLTSVWLPMLLANSILYPAMDKELNLTETYEALQKERWSGSAAEQ